jgi:KRAB domain-containing zinc finger protein
LGALSRPPQRQPVSSPNGIRWVEMEASPAQAERIKEPETLLKQIEIMGFGMVNCEECGLGFSKMTNLLSHPRIHSGEKPYVCGVCEKALSGKKSLARHQKVHSEKKKMCARSVGKVLAGSQHSSFMRGHTRVGEKP